MLLSSREHKPTSQYFTLVNGVDVLLCECGWFTLQSRRKHVAARVQDFCCRWHSVVWHAVQTTHLADAGTHLWTAPQWRHFIQWLCVCVCLCVYRVHSHLHWKNTCKAEGFTGDSEVIQKRWEQRCKSFSKYCWCVERSASATLLQSNWELSHFFKAPFKQQSSNALLFLIQYCGQFLENLWTNPEILWSQSEDKTAFSNLEMRLEKIIPEIQQKTCLGPFEQRNVFLKT